MYCVDLLFSLKTSYLDSVCSMSALFVFVFVFLPLNPLIKMPVSECLNFFNSKHCDEIIVTGKNMPLL